MRRTERIAVQLPVVWNRAGRAIRCHASDVNAHGMFLSTDEMPEHGALLHLVVELPEHTIDLYVTARFVGRTVSGQGIGAEIFLIDDVSQRHWITYYEGLVEREARKHPVAVPVAAASR